LWGDTYDRKLTDIFAVETEIAKTIADTLQAKLTGPEKTAMSKKPTENPEAHELYLKGRFFWNKRTADDLRRSIDYFDQAIAKDPNYALAYAGLAQAWNLLPAFNGGAPKDCFPKAESSARKALALDDTLSDAHAALASLKALNRFDYPGAIIEYELALQLNPNDATARQWFANDTLANIGQNERELAELKRAVELDPLSLIINSNLGWAYIHLDRLDEAIALPITYFEPVERLIAIAQAEINEGQTVSRSVALLSSLAQLLQDLLRFIFSALGSVKTA